MREGFSQGFQDNKKDNAKNKGGGISRRGLLKGFLGAAALGVAGVAAERVGLISGGVERYRKHDREKFLEAVKEEIEKLKKTIKESIARTKEFDNKFNKFNDLIDRNRSLPKNSPEYKRNYSILEDLDTQIQREYVKRGNNLVAPFTQSINFEESLLADRSALNALAAIRVAYREKTEQDLGYYSNCAEACLMLKGKDPEKIRQKIYSIYEWYDDSDKQEKFGSLSKVPFEKILNACIDDDFEPKLYADTVKANISKRSATWHTDKAMHTNAKRSYNSFNDLSLLDIFELNRLNAVNKQLSKKDFTESVFKGRDKDLKRDDTELGGVVPLPSVGSEAVLLEGKSHWDNESFVPTPELRMASFGAASEFHYHATKINEEKRFWGPSGGDDAFFNPGVVFSSVDKDTIMVHFYVGRVVGDWIQTEYKNDVVSLGLIQK